MEHENRVKHQIQYPSPEEVNGKQLTTVTTHNNVQNYYNEEYTYNINTH